ncbi:hypothetical protein [Arthrobacter mobilis]|jgi:hypothetical protein|uniref:Uncharacterized protein n=1 Tax=Arthrobacter mobilis TaxID=2724944 RepID=A0A7X6HC38_9MICC|nr:hypothetical protein [Arthrobacter mobilis]NKX52997.1 hypothetical protein [Arthrobacter mobilis]
MRFDGPRNHPDDDQDGSADPLWPERDLAAAVDVAELFCGALADRQRYRKTLETLVAPATRMAWGDFHAAAWILQSIPAYRVTDVHSPPGNPDVAHVDLGSATNPLAVAVLKLVWSRQLQAWLVDSLH